MRQELWKAAPTLDGTALTGHQDGGVMVSAPLATTVLILMASWKEKMQTAKVSKLIGGRITMEAQDYASASLLMIVEMMVGISAPISMMMAQATTAILGEVGLNGTTTEHATVGIMMIKETKLGS